MDPWWALALHTHAQGSAIGSVTCSDYADDVDLKGTGVGPLADAIYSDSGRGNSQLTFGGASR